MKVVNKYKEPYTHYIGRGFECDCEEAIIGFKLYWIIQEMIKNDETEREIA